MTAIDDLADIHPSVAGSNDVAAEKPIVAIISKIIEPAARENIGSPRDSILPGRGAFPFRQRCICFRVTDGDLQVPRIFHARRDITADLFEVQ